MEEVILSDIIFKEKKIKKFIPELLKDHTTGKNIIWATDTYAQFGEKYHKEKQMFPDFNIKLITDGIMLPRIMKTKDQQLLRTKGKAEVFTPSWVCNKMNNYCDEQWFKRKDVFNVENKNYTWIPTTEPIDFSKSAKDWKKYIDSRRIEITCGEAPYIVSRYDTTTGEYINIEYRIGILDRKLRVVNENTENEEEWLKWTYRAYESVYGYEYQGDNLFFARVNLVQTFIEYYDNIFKKNPTDQMIKKITKIVSWNLWQMDGLKDIVPFGIPEEYEQIDFNNLNKKTKKENKHIYCKIKDWRSRKIIEYRSMKGEK